MDSRRAWALDTVVDAIERDGPSVEFERLASSRPGLGHLLADRPAMIEAVMKRVTQRLLAAVNERMDEVPEAQLDERIRVSVDTFLRWLDGHRNLCRFALRHGFLSTVFSDILRRSACEHSLQTLRAGPAVAGEADVLELTASAMMGASEAMGVAWIRRDFQPEREIVALRLHRQLTALAGTALDPA